MEEYFIRFCVLKYCSDSWPIFQRKTKLVHFWVKIELEFSILFILHLYLNGSFSLPDVQGAQSRLITSSVQKTLMPILLNALCLMLPEEIYENIGFSNKNIGKIGKICQKIGGAYILILHCFLLEYQYEYVYIWI